MCIYLIGMPGSGKSTVGKKLALELGIEFIDLDHIIELDQMMFIDEIFERYGEDFFRDVETETLQRLNIKNAVVSTGGGIVMRKGNKVLMQGLCIYLDTKIEIIQARIIKDYQRPLLKQVSLENLYDERFLKYQHFADVIVSNNYHVDHTVKQILDIIKEREKNEN